MFTLTYSTGMALQSGTAGSADSVKQEINDLKRMWNKEFVACLRVLSRHFPGRKEEQNKSIVRHFRCQAPLNLIFCRKEARSVASYWPKMFLESYFNNGGFVAHRNPVSFLAGSFYI
jgi:hypothetical protein